MTPRARFDIYVASCDTDGGICRFSVSESGELLPLEKTPLDRPMYMIESDGVMHVLQRETYPSGESGLVSFRIAEGGELTAPSEVISTRGRVACHLCAVDGEIYAANYISGSVFRTPDKVIAHSGSGADKSRQASPHTHFVSPTPDGEYILVSDLGVDKIFVYTRELELISLVDIPSGHGPRHLALHPDGRHIFSANELASTVSLLEYESGRLKLIDTVSVLPEGYCGESTVAAIRAVGDRIFVSNRGHNSISQLSFDGESLRLEGRIPSHGGSPRDFIVKDDLLIVANELSDQVCIISADTGELLGCADVKSPVCVTLGIK